MIFVTVGTHEQQFNRLIEEIDRLKKDGIIKEDVFIQTGFSTYEPKYCKWNKLIPYEDMEKYNKEAELVITHGGPASFVAPLSHGKIPIVVPRQFQFDEHVNNHQLEFAKEVASRMKNIIVIEDVKELKNVITNYKKLVSKMSKDIANNNAKFNELLKKEIQEIL